MHTAKFKRLGLKLTLLGFGQFFMSCGQSKEASLTHRLKEAWSRRDAPANLIDEYKVRFDELALKAELEEKPWADSYWPDFTGGLSWRWQAEQDSDQSLPKMPSKEELLALDAEQINKLSPAEKYDILVGNYDYPFTRFEQARTSSSSPAWFGLCHGWAAASYQFKEPQAVALRNQDGLLVSFASSDIKALLTYAQQYQRPASATRFLGLRCDQEAGENAGPDETPSCKGVNAGAFHLILGNFIARAKKPFVMDVSRGSEVWNFPVYGYTSRLIAESEQVHPGAAAATKRVVELETTVQFIKTISPQREALAHRSRGQYHQLTYHYVLELNQKGEIIGGEWKDGRRPDFIWVQSPATFRGYFAQVAPLYEKAISASAPSNEE